jgi:uncharacterized phage infection (PIP) family protein YhgE
MANLDTLEQEVAGLIRDESNDFEFRNAFINIEEAVKTTTNAEREELQDILSNFRGKIPNRINLKPIRAGAKDLADTLTIKDLKERIDSINSRNELLGRLTSELKTQIDKANKDANLLKQIKDGVDKATKTIVEIRSLINQLTDSDVSTKEKLIALVTELDKISSIFKPQST